MHNHVFSHNANLCPHLFLITAAQTSMCTRNIYYVIILYKVFVTLSEGTHIRTRTRTHPHARTRPQLISHFVKWKTCH